MKPPTPLPPPSRPIEPKWEPLDPLANYERLFEVGLIVLAVVIVTIILNVC